VNPCQLVLIIGSFDYNKNDMKITKLTPQTKNPQRVNVFVDGAFYCGVDASVAFRLSLSPGMVITPEISGELSTQDEFARGWNYALRCLRVASQSVRRLREKLTRRLENEELADEIMKRLIEADLVNDQRLAESVIARFASSKTKSVREIRLLLQKKGISPALIRSLETNLNEIDPKEAIAKLAEGKLRQVRDSDPKVRFEKTAAYLARKGFRYNEIKAVLDELLLSRDL